MRCVASIPVVRVPERPSPPMSGAGKRAPVLMQISTGATAMSCGIGAKDCATFFSMAGFCRFCRQAFPAGTAGHLAALTGATVSTAEKWLRGETKPSAAHLGALTAAFGPAFLAATMPATRAWTERAARNEAIVERARDLVALIAAE